jgi:general secretion pathway protein B
MSLILEALRKSDAERRLGSAPDLLAPMPLLRSVSPRRRWPPVVAVALLLIAILVLVVWWPVRTTQPPNGISIRAQLPLHARDFATARDAAPIKRQDASPASVHRQQTRTPPTLALPTTVDSTRNHATGSDPSPATLPSSAAAGERTWVAAPKPSPGPSDHPGQVAADAHVANAASHPPPPPFQSAPAAGTAQRMAATAPATAPFLKTADTSTGAAPLPAPAPVDEPALLALTDLSADERSNLPALRVTMHVYADAPAQRFMIIDGQRVGEGARLADGVILVRIRHDGAEIDAHGRRLLLPKP